MRPRVFRRRLIAAAAGIVTAGAVVGLAAPARADEFNDYAYLNKLDTHGIYYNSVPTAIEAGHAVCKALDSGIWVENVVEIASRASGYSVRDTFVIVEASIGAYCPQYAYLVTTVAR